MRRLHHLKPLILLIVPALSACSSSGGDGGSSIARSEPAPIDSAYPSPGGLWVGADSDGNAVTALADENGVFYFIDGRYEDGTGLLTVVNRTNIQGKFRLPQEPGVPDETPESDCKLSGPVVERESMRLEVACRQSQNQQFETILDLAYDPRYEQMSALTTIAGNYDYDVGVVLNVAGDGSVFGQDGQTGCVTSGQVRIIDPAYSVYEVELRFENCSTLDSNIDRTTLFGRAMLDRSASPEFLTISVSGSAGGSFVSFTAIASRL